jgi:hypothetical protein
MNPITHVKQAWFSQTVSLNTLRLDGTSLTTIEPSSFDSLTSLQVLDLGDVLSLTSLPSELFKFTTALLSLDLSFRSLPPRFLENCVLLQNLFVL